MHEGLLAEAMRLPRQKPRTLPLQALPGLHVPLFPVPLNPGGHKVMVMVEDLFHSGSM